MICPRCGSSEYYRGHCEDCHFNKKDTDAEEDTISSWWFAKEKRQC